MRLRGWLLALSPLLAAGCAEPDKEWMKINQSYTAEEFRRDVAACTKSGHLDEGCLRGRGWVSVNPPKDAAKPIETPPSRAPGSYKR